ncbi:MAG TPA: tetratricopeptide repeat protein, partial [Polyangiaceae bacterium]
MSSIDVKHLEVSGGVAIQVFGAEPEVPSLAWRQLSMQTSIWQLFDWRYRLVPLCSRDEELKELLNWAQSGCGPRVRFLTGQGGAGKTRLAAEVAERLRAMKWEAGFVRLEGNPTLNLRKPGRLLIVDYPDDKRAQIAELFEQLSALECDGPSLRILLLSREPFAHWKKEIYSASAMSLCDSQEIALSALTLPQSIALCRGVWNQIPPAWSGRRHLAEVSDQVIATWVERNHALHGCPLYILAAALHYALDTVSTFELSGAEVIDALVQRECARLNRLPIKDFAPSAIGRILALAFIGGGLAPDTLRDLADPRLELGLPCRVRVVDPLKRSAWWRNGRLAAPGPDIVGAALMHQVLSEVEEDRLVSEWLWPVLRDSLRNQRAEQLLGRIDRADYDIRSIRDSCQLPEWCRGVIALQGPNSALERAKALADFVDCEPQTGSLSLVCEVTATLARDARADHPRRVVLLNSLGVTLSALGRGEEALHTTAEALEICRGLAIAHREEFLPYLASILNNRGIRLSDWGRREEALQVTVEAVDVSRELSTRSPEEYLPYLATSLTNMGIVLSDLGRHKDALEAIAEAVEIRRGLSRARPDTYLPYLATSLNNQGEALSELGRREEALHVTLEALSIYRELARARPEASLPSLAGCLNNLGA